MPLNIGGTNITSTNVKILNDTNVPLSGLTNYYDAGLVDSYSGAGNTVYNFVGNVNGTLQNGVTYSTNGGGTFVFDGADDRILLDNSNYSITLGNGNTNWTVYAWIKTTSAASGLSINPILSNTNGGPIYGSFNVNNGRQTYWVYPSDINNWKQFVGNITVNNDVWHCLTWVNNSNYTMNFYTDGIFDTTVSPTNSGNNNPMDVIGGGYTGSSFPGSIGLVAVYNGTAHTLLQVTQFFNSTRQRFGV